MERNQLHNEMIVKYLLTAPAEDEAISRIVLLIFSIFILRSLDLFSIECSNFSEILKEDGICFSRTSKLFYQPLWRNAAVHLLMVIVDRFHCSIVHQQDLIE